MLTLADAALTTLQKIPPIIRFEDVTIRFKQETIVSNINFAVYPGQKALICGKSGSGKSSILKILSGLISPDSGTVYFREQRLNPQIVKDVRRQTAYIGQEPMLGAASVREALLLPFQFQFQAHHARQPNQTQLIEVLRRLQLPAELLDKSAQDISGGEKQRVALARGLLLNKTIYLLDEATSALDADSRATVFDIFSDPKLTVLAVTHDNDWLAHCTTVFEISNGQLARVTNDGND